MVPLKASVSAKILKLQKAKIVRLAAEGTHLILIKLWICKVGNSAVRTV